MKFCPFCGKEQRDGSKFCYSCGASLAGEQRIAPAQQGNIAKKPKAPSRGSKIVLNIFSFFISVILILAGTLYLVGGLAENSIFMVLMGLVFFAISIINIVSISKSNNQSKKDDTQTNIDGKKTPPKLTYRQRLLADKEKKYRKMKYKFTFVSGLPLMPGALCKVISTSDKIIIDSQGTLFELAKDKITSIAIEKNITNYMQAVSSAGGALAGAMAFGAIGAAIGGRTTPKNVKAKRYYLIITYFDNEESVKYIVFDNNYKATYLVDDFKTFNKDRIVKKVVEIK